jgi:hypothetical protein
MQAFKAACEFPSICWARAFREKSFRVMESAGADLVRPRRKGFQTSIFPHLPGGLPDTHLPPHLPGETRNFNAAPRGVKPGRGSETGTRLDNH